MTEEEKNKPKKLTLSSSKLSLGTRSIDQASLKQSFLNAKNKTVTVEVKKNKASSLSVNSQSNYSDAKTDALTAELSKKLSIFKKAEEIKAKEDKSDDKPQERIGTLSFSYLKPNQEEELATESSVAVEEESKIIVDVPTEKEEKDNYSKVSGVHHKKSSIDDEEDEDSLSLKKKLSDSKTSVVKAKIEEPKKLRKTDLINMLGEEENDHSKTRSLASIKRAREKEKRKLQQNQSQEKLYREVIIPEMISVGELASRMTERTADVIRELMKLGIMANANQDIDADTAELVVGVFGHSLKRVQESDVENILQDEQDLDSMLEARAPVVTVMGHVDHGKTSLLDALKSTDVVSKEAGGITQHIGAYRVMLENGSAISFIDTPGHAAFTEMRIRGAQVTDIVVLVVAADDGIKAQTIEAINHAKAANVPIIVAINKIDKADANIEKVKQELLQYELIPEDLGGDVIVVPVSAKSRLNLEKLEESILLLAEMLNLRANPNVRASGAVIESKIDKNKGVSTTVLVQRGTLRIGDIIVAGESVGRVKVMINDKGKHVKTASPSEPVELFGLDIAPSAGDKINVVQSDKQAREIAEYRMRTRKTNKISITHRSSLEELFLKASGNGSTKELPVIVKSDVQGSSEAIISSITKLSTPAIRLKVLHSAVGGINESDITLAKASGAMIVGFNVRASSAASLMADKEGVDIRYYSIIYNLIDDIKSIMSGMLAPIIREVYIGSVEIRQVFNITKVGKVAGSYVTKGIIKRGAGVRLLRDNIVIHEGKLKTLKRFKDDVKEVRENYECGIAFENYEDIRALDVVEVFERIEEKQEL